MPSPPCLSAVSVYSVFAILGFILTVVSSHPPTHRAESSSSARRPGTTREHFMSITQFPTSAFILARMPGHTCFGVHLHFFDDSCYHNLPYSATCRHHPDCHRRGNEFEIERTLFYSFPRRNLLQVCNNDQVSGSSGRPGRV